ncbi:MAG: DUF4082 domain-containing protein [Bryobacteraceae bacterium]|nr:DUF4082 domain-containing protein [Bryobacteraceae bacterium]
MRTLIQTIVLSGALACASYPAFIGMGTSGGTPTTPRVSGTIGFLFSVNTAVNLTDLGYWDEGGDGLIDPHQVGIWDAVSNTLVASVTVPTGTGGTLLGGFRFVSVGAPIALAAGNYVLGGFTLAASENVARDRFLIEPTLTPASQLSFLENRSVTGASLALPTTTSPFLNAAFFGPNLQIAAIDPPNGQVPEPSTMASMALGVVLVAIGAYRRRTNSAA